MKVDESFLENSERVVFRFQDKQVVPKQLRKTVEHLQFKKSTYIDQNT